jgi:hypothetical protein
MVMEEGIFFSLFLFFFFLFFSLLKGYLGKGECAGSYGTGTRSRTARLVKSDFLNLSDRE